MSKYYSLALPIGSLPNPRFLAQAWRLQSPSYLPMSQRQASESEPGVERDASGSQADDWAAVRDPTERRKIQNKLAQRRFREKQKDQKEESERRMENERRAGSAYTLPDTQGIDPRSTLSGLPWGGLSIQHIVESGKSKEQRSQQSSRETSVYAVGSRTGGSSRLGLHLTDQFARGAPAWRYFPLSYPFGHPNWSSRRVM